SVISKLKLAVVAPSFLEENHTSAIKETIDLFSYQMLYQFYETPAPNELDNLIVFLNKQINCLEATLGIMGESEQRQQQNKTLASYQIENIIASNSPEQIDNGNFKNSHTIADQESLIEDLHNPSADHVSDDHTQMCVSN